MIYNLVRKHAVDIWSRQFWILHGPKEENWSAPFLNLGNERVWRRRKGRDSSALQLDQPSRLLPPDNSFRERLSYFILRHTNDQWLRYPFLICSWPRYEVKYQLEPNVNNIYNTFINFYFAFCAVNKQLFNDGIVLLMMANMNRFSWWSL